MFAILSVLFRHIKGRQTDSVKFNLNCGAIRIYTVIIYIQNVKKKEIIIMIIIIIPTFFFSDILT